MLKFINTHTASWTYWAYDYDTQNEFGIINKVGFENPQLDFLINLIHKRFHAIH